MAEESIMRIVDKFVDTLELNGIGVDKVIIYGSYAKGNPEAESDIDVAIVSKGFGKDRVEEGMLLFRLAGSVDSRIEPVPISSKSYEEDTWIPLIYEIRTRGIELKR